MPTRAPWLALILLASCTPAGPTPADAAADAQAVDGGLQDARPALDQAAMDQDQAVLDAAIDAEPLDLGEPDGALRDAAPQPDAGLPCAQAGDCPQGTFCDFPAGQCGGLGACAERPAACPEPGDADAVCACDGRSYPSACAAAQAGMAVDQAGACQAPERCDQDADCGAGAFCASLPGACGEAGRCQARPEGCDDVYDPVCGCDGQTWANACEAAAAVVSLASMGACPPPPCAGDGACEADHYCAKAACDAPTGECAPRPAACDAVVTPVCGCDGVTYNNACEAASAGENVLGNGECLPPECSSNADCAVDEWCARDDGLCDAVGHCEVRRGACPRILHLVCGCDGNTYSNNCVANSQGVVVAADGECPGCMHRNDCDGDEYCLQPTGGCGLPGACEPTPEICPQVFAPVCGCDGMTYGNECTAAAAGTSVDYAGECRAR